MTPQQEQELLQTMSLIAKKLKAIEKLVLPYIPKKDEIIGTDEAVELLNISRSKLFMLISDGVIPSSKVGRRRKFSKNALIKWVNNQYACL